MMKMKLFLATLFVATVANAQSFRIAPTANISLNSSTGDFKNSFGYNVGARGEISLDKDKKWFADASVLFDSQKWDSDGWYYNNVSCESYLYSYNTYSLRIPVTLGYRFSVGNNVQLFASAGPFLTIGLSGKEKVTTNADASSTQNAVSDNMFKDKILNRINAGVILRLGTEIKDRYVINVSYEHGFTNRFTKQTGLTSRENLFSLGIGYKF